MDDTTKLLLGAALVGGAVYLAMRRDPALDDEEEDGSGSICDSKLGEIQVYGVKAGPVCKLAGPVAEAVVKAAKAILPEPNASCNRSYRGWWAKDVGFTGRCHRMPGKNEWTDGTEMWDRILIDTLGLHTRVCCPPGATEPKCKDRRNIRTGTCVQGFGTVRDQRTGAQ